jgi:hypothetical protein
MEARYKRKIESGQEYDGLFPKAESKNIPVRVDADVDDTLKFIPKAVKQTLHHTEQLAPMLKGSTLEQTCRNIWEFVYRHIAYRKDADGIEQVRSPARVWQDRKQGVDCDCYTTFISSILTNLNIPHTYRITKYFKPHFQHIYPIVPTPNGKYITIDCVVEQFNYEEPFSEKKDTPMDLHFLNGLDDRPSKQENLSVDAYDLMGYTDESLSYEVGEMGEVGELGLFRRKHKANQPPAEGKKRNIFQKILHVANKANPATVLLRNGILASMKLNLFKVAQRLKWAYLTDAQAQAKGINMEKFDKLKKVRSKLEVIFYGSGGKPENLKKAVLKGKGNRGKEVSGLGYMDYNEYTPIGTLLGDIYDGDINGLGEPATGAAIAAATAAVTAIAAILKSVGNIFQAKNGEGNADFENAENAGAESTESPVTIDENKTVAPSITEEGKANPESNIAPQSNATTEVNSGGGNNNSGGGNNAMMRTSETPASNSEETENGSGEKGGSGKMGELWDKHKKWAKPTLIAVGASSVLFVGYKMMAARKHPQPAPVNGLEGTKRKRRTHPKSKRKANGKKTIKSQSLFN